MAGTLVKLLDSDKVAEFAKMDEFLTVVNSNPPTTFIKNHPMATGVKYLPIDKVELLLTKIFQQWKVEILREGQLLNSIFTTIRLHYKHPITGEWEFQDGTGAAPIQTDKGKSAADMAAIKNDAIMKALPAAESYAIKDAAEKIGTVFGKDLNRSDTLGFTKTYTADEPTTTLEAAVSEIEKATSKEEFKKILASLTPEQKREVTPIINERIKELKDGEDK